MDCSMSIELRPSDLVSLQFSNYLEYIRLETRLWPVIVVFYFQNHQLHCKLQAILFLSIGARCTSKKQIAVCLIHY